MLLGAVLQRGNGLSSEETTVTFLEPTSKVVTTHGGKPTWDSTFRPDVDRRCSGNVTEQTSHWHRTPQAPVLVTFFKNWWYEDNGTDESEGFLWTRLQFKVNRLGTASASSLEPLRDKWVTFAHEMNRQAPSGLSFVTVSNTWTRLSLEERVVGSSTLVLAFTPCTSTCVCQCWS